MGDGRSQSTASVGSLIDIISTVEAEARHLLASVPTASSVVGSTGALSGQATASLLVMMLRFLESSGFIEAFRQALSESVPSGTPEPASEQTRMEEELGQLREKTARFEEAMRALAKTQGRCLAKMDDGSHADHGLAAVKERLDAFERDFDEFRTAHRSNTHGMLEGFEGIRTRLSKLEARGSEISREARAKTGRLDAMSRHLASVERKLEAAIGAGTPGRETTVHAAG